MVPVVQHRDGRGDLTVFELSQSLGFAARRIFLIEGPAAPDAIARANHATTGKQLITVLNGSCRLEIDNGVEKQSLLCKPNDYAVLVGPGVWRRICDMTPSTLILVAAELSYSETQYFDAPVPALVQQQPDVRI